MRSTILLLAIQAADPSRVITRSDIIRSAVRHSLTCSFLPSPAVISGGPEDEAR